LAHRATDQRRGRRKKDTVAEQVTFAAQRRTVTGKAVRQLRKQGIVPGNIVASGRDSVAIQLNGLDFQRYLAKNAPTTVLRLILDGGKAGETVMVQRVEHEPVTRAILHVDFIQVNMSQAMRARVPIHMEGDAPGVKTYNGLLLTLLDHVEVEARPADLPQALPLDVTGLTELNMMLHVSDIAVPKNVKVLTDPDEAVVRLEPPRTIEAAPAPTEAAEAAAEAPAAPEASEPSEA
jgi:large subunit ribosomal protein L25